MLSDLRIIFFGTPEFAVASLEKLIENGVNIVAVVTAPDKPAGRGMQLKASPVKQCAQKHHLPVLQPTHLKDENFLQTLRSFHADLQIVIAFRMLPEAVWSMPPLGTINLHASLLPNYRGAAPINWAIINGETVTGVTTFKLKHEIDTGDIIEQRAVPIEPDDNAGTLHDKLMHAGAELVLSTVKKIASGQYNVIPQPKYIAELKKAPKIFTETCRIDWNKQGRDIINHIRGLSPYPGAFTYVNNKILKIFSARFEPHVYAELQPGEYIIQPPQFYFICSDGIIIPDEVQPEGKKKMTAREWLNGWR